MIDREPKHAVIVVSPSGGGKTTLTQLAVDRGYRRIATRDLLMANCHSDVVANGDLAPDSLIRFLIKGAVPDEEKKVVFDGAVRTVEQAKWLFNFLDVRGYLLSVFYLQVPKQVAIDRIKLRYVFQQRPEDGDEAIISKRLALYDEHQGEIINHLRMRRGSHILHLDAERPIEVVSSRFTDLLRDMEVFLKPKTFAAYQ